MTKSLLLVFPHNPFERKSGVHERFFQLLVYLKSRDYEVDLFSLSQYESLWDNKSPFNSRLIRKLYLSPFPHPQPPPTLSFLEKSLISLIKLKPSNWYELSIPFPDLAYSPIRTDFLNIIKNQKYNYIVIGYAFWANLIDLLETKQNPTTIIMIEDFLSLQLATLNQYRKVGSLIDQEIELINKFDHAVSIANSEYNFFSKLAIHPQHHLIPHSTPDPKPTEPNAKNIDILYVGHDNPHNVQGMTWFIEQVLPLLPPSVNIQCIGLINQKLGSIKDKRVKQTMYLKDLNNAFQQSKLSICPLFSGTGLKIKIVQSLANGVPVIATSSALSGISSFNNGCVEENQPETFANSIMAILGKTSYRARLSKQARIYYLQHFSPEVIYTKLDQIFI